jgi:hypothetical protein
MKKADRIDFRVHTNKLEGVVRFLVEVGVVRLNIRKVASSYSPSAGTRRTYSVSCLVPEKMRRTTKFKRSRKWPLFVYNKNHSILCSGA